MLNIKTHVLAFFSELVPLVRMVECANSSCVPTVVYVLVMADGDTPCFDSTFQENGDGEHLSTTARKMVELCYETGKSTRELALNTCLPAENIYEYFVPGGVVDIEHGVAVACCGPDPIIAEIIAKMYLAAIVGFKQTLIDDPKEEPILPDPMKFYTLSREGVRPDDYEKVAVPLNIAVNHAAFLIHTETKTPQHVSVSSHNIGMPTEEHLVCSFCLTGEGEQNPDTPAVVRFRITRSG